VKPGRFLNIYHRFGCVQWFHVVLNSSVAWTLKMVSARRAETSVNIYQSTQRHFSEYLYLHEQGCKNITFHNTTKE